MILKDPELIAYASRGSTGTSNSHKRVNPEFLLSYHIPYETSTVSKFSEFINSIQIQVLKNRDEITLLASQRDELLPLLMNEQVSVKLTKVNCDSYYQFPDGTALKLLHTFKSRILKAP